MGKTIEEFFKNSGYADDERIFHTCRVILGGAEFEWVYQGIPHGAPLLLSIVYYTMGRICSVGQVDVD